MELIVNRNITMLASCLLFALSASNAVGLTWEYDQTQIKRAGDGCVGGHVSSFGSNTAYYRGDTDLLNKTLKELSEQFAATSRIEIRIYDGTKIIEYGEESPLGTLNPKSHELKVDWSISKLSMQHRETEKRLANLPWPSFVNLADHDTLRRIPYRLPPSTAIVISVWKGDRIIPEEIDCPTTIDIKPTSK